MFLHSLGHSRGRQHHIEDIIQESRLQCAIVLGGRVHRWRCVDFDKPRLQVVIDNDVIAVDLETVRIVGNYWRDSVQRMPDGFMNASREQLGDALAPNTVQIEPQVLYGPFAAVYDIELFLQEGITDYRSVVIFECNLHYSSVCSRW